MGKWGIKLTEIQPFEAHPGDWNWDYVPVPTKLCDQCAERVEAGEKPACVKHCQSFCMEYGTPEEMAKRAEARRQDRHLRDLKHCSRGWASASIRSHHNIEVASHSRRVEQTIYYRASAVKEGDGMAKRQRGWTTLTDIEEFKTITWSFLKNITA